MRCVLQQSSDPCVYVIDEVGKMEMFSESFIREVKDILDNSSRTTLITIPVARAKPVPFVEEIRNKKDSVLYQVIKSFNLHYPPILNFSV